MINNIQVRDVAQQCLRDEATAILGIIPQLDEEFDRVVELLLHCTGKVIVTGVGKSGHVAAKIAATMASTGTPAFYLNPLDAFHGDLGMISANDIVIALSNSGQTDELLRIVPFLKEHNIVLVGVSGNSDSLLARNCNHHILLHVEHEACPLNLAPTSSTTAQLALGDALAVALMEVRDFKARDFAQFHPGGSLGRRLLSVACDVMRTENLPTLTPEMRLSEAVIHVSKGKMGMAVVMKDDIVVGVITDGDVRRAMQTHREDFFDVVVEEVMTSHPKCVGPNEKLSQVQRMLQEYNIHAMPVTDADCHLLGVVDSLSCML
ncbi:MAG: KpsF/GutQ family sugar-phosphate isomerase [Bacteroidaceae bacterium]|nr:KpsF/GutQ family sugar-phosphate isomerase [Bacteroidaceae bacterium]